MLIHCTRGHYSSIFLLFCLITTTLYNHLVFVERERERGGRGVRRERWKKWREGGERKSEQVHMQYFILEMYLIQNRPSFKTILQVLEAANSENLYKCMAL